MQFVFSCIKLSYDYMKNKEAKICLLFCSMFSSLYPITEDQLFHYMTGENQIEDVEDLAGARSRLHSTVGRLISACFLLKAENGRIRMHDVVREVAKSIAYEEDNRFIIRAGRELKDWPDMQLDLCKRLSLMYTTVECRVPNQIKAKSLLTLSFHGNVGLDELPSGFFEEMTSLMTLDLSYTGITALPTSIDCLVSLRTLRLEGCDVTDVLLSNKLGTLQILSLRYSNIERLHVSGEILGLKLLDLSSTQRLESISPKVISTCLRLEELYALKSKGWTSQSANGGEASLSSLTLFSHLRTLELHIENQEFLSRNIPCWESLDRFKLVVGAVKKFSSVGVAGDGVQFNSMYLQLRTWSSAANWVKVLLRKTDLLHLDGNVNFSDGWSADEMFCQLRELTISDYKSTKLFTSFDLLLELSHLEKLVVEDCPELESLIEISEVPIIQQSVTLPNLTCLRVSDCRHMNFLLNIGGVSGVSCENIWDLPKLKVLNILDLTFLGLSPRDHRHGEIFGYNKKGNHYSLVSEGILMKLPVLEELIVEGAPNVRKLPLCDVPKLTKFTADHYWFDQLEWEDQSLRRRLQYLLKYLHLDGDRPSPIPVTSSSPHEILPYYLDQSKTFSNLRTLKVSNHGLASYVPYDLLTSLQNVEKLMIHDCHDLAMLIEFDQDYWESKLKASFVGASVSPSSSPSISMIKVFPNLTFLRITESGRLQHLFQMGTVLDLLKLETLYIERCSSIEMVIMNEMSQVQEQLSLVRSSIGAGVIASASKGKLFPELKVLNISFCAKLRYLFPLSVVGDLLKIEKISVSHCTSFEAVFEHEKVEAVEEERSLLNISDGVGAMMNASMRNSKSNLRTLHISNCNKPKYLFSMRAAQDLSQLERISIVSCDSIETLIVPEKKAGAGVEQVSFAYASIGAASGGACSSISISTRKSSVLALSTVLSNLTFLEVSSCSLLKYIFSLEAIQNMLQLKEIQINSCSSMETIVLPEKEAGAVVEQVSFANAYNGAASRGASSSTNTTTNKSSVLPPSPVSSNLTILRVSSCSMLKYIFPLEAIQCMLQLKEIHIRYCFVLETLIAPEENAGAVVEQVSLANAPLGSASGVASSSSSTDTSKSSVLPPSPVLFKLTTLRVSYCSMLKYIFPLEAIQNMLQLKEIHIGNCSSMEMIIAGGNHGPDNSKVVFPELKVLSLRRLPKLSSLADQNLLFYFPALEELTVEDCGSLEKLPLANVASVPNLNKFTADPVWFNELEWEDQHLESYLGRLIDYVHLQGRKGSDDHFSPYQMEPESLQNIKALKVSGVHRRRTSVIPSGFLVSLLELEMLEVEDCSASERLLEYEKQNEEQESIDYPALGASSSSVTRAREIPKLPQSLEFPNLRRIKVCNCSKVKYLFPAGVVRGLFQLQELHISDCSSLEMIIIHEELPNDYHYVSEDKALLPSLKILRLQGLKELSRFVRGDILFDWPYLKVLTLNSCPALKKLPFGRGSVSRLAKLEMSPSKDLFDKLEWEDQSIKSRLRKLL